MSKFEICITKRLFNTDIDDFSFSIIFLAEKFTVNLRRDINYLGIKDIIKLRDAINQYIYAPKRPHNSKLFVEKNCESPDRNVGYEIRRILEDRYVIILDATNMSGGLNNLSEEEVIVLSEKLTQIINVYVQGGEL